MPRSLGIRVDGNGHIGLGHIFRCLHLADGLRKADVEAVFLMLESSRTGRVPGFLEKSGYGVFTVSGDDPWRQDDARLTAVLQGQGLAVILVDQLVPDATDDDLLGSADYQPADLPGTLKLLQGQGMRVACISDRYDRMDLDVEIVFNGCPAQDPAWYEAATATRYRLGPDYYMLPESFRRCAATPRAFRTARPKTLLFFGGNDHCGFTAPTLEALAPLRDRIDVEAIVGAATPDGDAVASGLRAQGITVHYGAPDLAPILADADLAFLASGNTLFDAAALGLPALALSTRVRQRVTAQHFDRVGSAIDLGTMDDADWPGVTKLVEDLIFDVERLQTMRAAGRAEIDGDGMKRVIDDLLSLY